jgi:hypothetical protein
LNVRASVPNVIAHAKDVPAPRLVPTLDSPWKQKDRVQDPPVNGDSWSSRPRTISAAGGSGSGPLGYSF